MSLLPKRFEFDDFFDDFLPLERKDFALNDNMKCDIYEKDGKYHLEMDLPGFKKEDLKVECENGYLTISAEHHEEKNDNSKKYIRKERTYNKYQRNFYLGEVKEEDVKAQFENGILKVSIPMASKKESKKLISID